MSRGLVAVVAVAVSLTVLAAVLSPASHTAGEPDGRPGWKSNVSGSPASALFAGGCFWCIEAVYDDKTGVVRAVSGYAGGRAATATYRQVATGRTEHREAVRVDYYPSVVSYEELLDAYWRSIDPTDPGGQFSDRGPQYTTAIYAYTPRQYRLAQQSKQELNASGRFENPVVTEILNYTTFFRAEQRHQNYSRKNS
ncbi:MAG: peptide-methionine (S)-S-oxide reductase MsrA, partial [Candidatus Nanohaloarchaea archaeon]|nr:peptide-methionine (S)-S-oxide reductase MsrA [Candidatus Nanohaloarchaea archaeon]